MKVSNLSELQGAGVGARAFTRRDVLLGAGCASVLGVVDTAHGLCGGSPELGRWRITLPNVNPELLDLRMTNCEEDARYRLRAWVRQSDGKWYGRPSVKATWEQWQGKRWLVGSVSTGGYVDEIWTRAVQRDGKRMLHVYINHKSLDSKPSSTDEYWYQFVEAI